MDEIKLADGEYKFVNVIWEYEPINSTELVKLTHNILGWKKSTTYTVLRKLCDRGILKNEDTIVTAIIKKDEYQNFESGMVVKKTFNNSLPAFVAAFLSDKKLSQKEAREIQKLIEEASGDN